MPTIRGDKPKSKTKAAAAEAAAGEGGDPQFKKRGRPKAVDRAAEVSAAGAGENGRSKAGGAGKKAAADKAVPEAPRRGRGRPRKEKPEPEKGIDRKSDLPWSEGKVAVFKALKTLKARGPNSARSAKDVADIALVTTKMVRHYCYHARAAGLTEVVRVEGITGYGFYLTEKGLAVNPDRELKAQRRFEAMSA